ncbi:hypothetical protein KO505_04810 [Psychrosphaera sp. F3M07]|uniref:hypothetical protein n=1 Tax=Psychrosphaera sp. F3M07 TaxID=2841560 RepID=UPI001C08E6A0|nr:hypothetical protein [Psychrosphaera sp. F3M07]MBU2917287.1 hypothetical protein [Psychrosphaera sp. F3M07]
MNIDKEFIKNWKLSFTYLYVVMVGCLIVRGLFMVLDGETQNITLISILSSFLIVTVGTGILTFFITMFGLKKEETD